MWCNEERNHVFAPKPCQIQDPLKSPAGSRKVAQRSGLQLCPKHLLGDPDSPLEMYIAQRQTSTSSPMRLVRNFCSWQGCSSIVDIPVQGAPSSAKCDCGDPKDHRKRVYYKTFFRVNTCFLAPPAHLGRRFFSPQLLLFLPFVSVWFYWCCYSCFLLKP